MGGPDSGSDAQQQQKEQRGAWVEEKVGGGLLFTAPVVFSTDSKFAAHR